MIDDEFKALLMHKIFFLFLCGQLWPEEDDYMRLIDADEVRSDKSKVLLSGRDSLRPILEAQNDS